MFNALLILFLLQTPVLYEGRFRPQETVPEGGQYTPLDVEDYNTIAGTVYLQAEGKALRYPTIGQLRAELILFRIPFKWIIIGSYLLAALCMLWKKWVGWAFAIFGFLLHTTALALRCYALMRPPVSNMHETLLYVPWIAMIVGMIFGKRGLVLIAATLISAILLLFLPSHTTLENVQAVLDSQYWLIVHVMMVVGSYGVFFLCGICGHLYLLQRAPSPSLAKTLIQTMYLGTALLICGTILGGVWAAESWGRFWDWDPKEAWAFISSGTYLIWIHAYKFKKIKERGLALGSIIGLMTITFTWYGVNYILGTGLHSYGFGSGGKIFYYIYLLGELLFVGLIFFKNTLYKNWVIEKKDRNR